MLVSTALTAGLIMSALLTVFILSSLAQNPRIWLKRAPQPLKDALPPLSEEESRLLKLWAIPIFAIAFLMPLATAFWYEQSTQQMNFGEAYLFIWIMFMCFNLVDLLFIDFFVVVWWQPAWSIVPEIKHLMHHVGYSYHMKAHVRGTIMLSVMALVFAGIVLLI